MSLRGIGTSRAFVRSRRSNISKQGAFLAERQDDDVAAALFDDLPLIALPRPCETGAVHILVPVAVRASAAIFR